MDLYGEFKIKSVLNILKPPILLPKQDATVKYQRLKRFKVLKHLKVPILCILPNQKADSECFCQLTGYLDDCSCEIEVLDSYNNKVIYPQLHQLLQRNYFRYYKGLQFYLLHFELKLEL